MIRWMRDAVSRCTSAGHEWLASDDPEACPDCLGWALAAAHRAGQEAMRERAAAVAARDADCNCGRPICQPDCARVRLLDLADAIRALEVSHD